MKITDDIIMHMDDDFRKDLHRTRNTIILWHAEAKSLEFNGLASTLEQFALINDDEPTEIFRWSSEDDADAFAALSALNCIIDTTQHDASVSEYWLEYCWVEDDGRINGGELPIFAVYKYITPTSIRLPNVHAASKMAKRIADKYDLSITGTPIFDKHMDDWHVTVTCEGETRLLRYRTNWLRGDEANWYQSLLSADKALNVISRYAEINNLVITGTPVFDEVAIAWFVTATDDGVSITLEIRTNRNGFVEINRR